MLPLGHASLAYLCYVGVAALTDRRLPARDALVPLLFASQLPDLVDKPLAYVGVLRSGRSLAHSLFALAVIAVAVSLLCRELARSVDSERLSRALAATPVPFAVGYATHLAGDAAHALLAGDYAGAGFLLYPVVPPQRAPSASVAPWIRLRRIYLDGGADALGPLVFVALAVFVGLRLRAYWRRRARRPR
ncbi:MAG: metal-dependent hydrolase [Haloferacaceae archaeon]